MFDAWSFRLGFSLTEIKTTDRSPLLGAGSAYFHSVSAASSRVSLNRQTSDAHTRITTAATRQQIPRTYFVTWPNRFSKVEITILHFPWNFSQLITYLSLLLASCSDWNNFVRHLGFALIERTLPAATIRRIPTPMDGFNTNALTCCNRETDFVYPMEVDTLIDRRRLTMRQSITSIEVAANVVMSRFSLSYAIDTWHHWQ